MELLTSLILLVVLAPPLFLAGKEAVEILLFNETGFRFGKRGQAGDVRNRHAGGEADPQAASVYDGMITVEIPVSGHQVVAYEPPPQIAGDGEVEVISPPSSVSRA